MKKNVLKSALCLSLSALVLSTTMSTTAFAHYNRYGEDAYVSDRTAVSNNMYGNAPYNGTASSYFNYRVSGFANRNGSTVTIDVRDDKVDEVESVLIFSGDGSSFKGNATLVKKELLKNSFHHGGNVVIHEIKGMNYQFKIDGLTSAKYIMQINFSDSTFRNYNINLI